MTEWHHHQWRLGRQQAVELFAQQIAFAELENAEMITLPLSAAKILLACARDGQHKGGGRRRPPDNQMDRVAKRAVIRCAQERMTRLVEEEGWKPRDAKNKAAEEAQERFGKRTGLSADTIKRSLKSKV